MIKMKLYLLKPQASTVFLKVGHPRILFCLISVFFKKTLFFTAVYHVKNVHPVSGAGIQTHNLWNASLLQQPLDVSNSF